MQTLLLLSLFGAIYSYAIYPLVLLCLPQRASQAAQQDTERPTVSLIIACRNEGSRISEKIRNSLALSYRPLEILVASDASDDESDDIVRSFTGDGVRLVRSPERRGKEHAQGLAAAAASGEILVFSDAGTTLPSDSLDHIVATFSDPRVGAVSSEDRFISSDGTLVGEGAYVRYEMWLRRLETRVNSLVGLSGSFFAIRRQVAESWDESIPSDFACALSARRRGFVAVADPRVVGIYRDIRDPSKEYSRKVRTALRGMTAIARKSDVLNPFRYGLFAFQVWSHKLMRWAVPWFLLAALLSNAALAINGTWRWLLVCQVLAYSVVLATHWIAPLRSHRLLRLPYFFLQVNLALAQAAIEFARGRRIVIWEPSVR